MPPEEDKPAIPFPQPEAPRPLEMPEELQDVLHSTYQRIVELGQETIQAAAQLSLTFGVPEAVRSPAFVKMQEHIDLALGFYAHRFASSDLPSIWARSHAKKED